MFDRATLSLGTTKVTSNVALRAGSSQQGNARRASVGCKKKFNTYGINACYVLLKTLVHVVHANHILITFYLSLLLSLQLF